MFALTATLQNIIYSQSVSAINGITLTLASQLKDNQPNVSPL